MWECFKAIWQKTASKMAINVNNVQPKQSYGIGLEISLVENELLFSTIFIQKLPGGVVVKPSCCNGVELILGSSCLLFPGSRCLHWLWNVLYGKHRISFLWGRFLHNVCSQREEEKDRLFRSIFISVLTFMFLIKWSRSIKNR